MLQSNSRIENLKGIRFYEQDILFDNHVYLEDIQITLKANYISPGIGFALINNEGESFKDTDESYLFKVGYKEVSIIYTNQKVQKKLYSASINYAPFEEDMLLTFKKVGKTIKIDLEGQGTILKFNLTNRMDKYQIGIYSNAGNIIKNLSIASAIPNGWNVNMNNTNGGYIKFYKNGFNLSNCMSPATVEQEDIKLKAGLYYLKHDLSEDSDYKEYVFLSSDKRLFDEDKNILDYKTNTFHLEEDSYINLKFKGKLGSVENIHITENENNAYVPTIDKQVIMEGSSIKLLKKDLKEVEWSGTIYTTPNDFDIHTKETYSVVDDNLRDFKMEDLSIYKERHYKYKYNLIDSNLEVSNKDSLVSQKDINKSTDYITIFKNVNAVIDQLTLTFKNGDVVNLVVEKTSKKYVPASVMSPIIVVNKNELPLDLSSSYRVVRKNGIDNYIFTNYEREYFEPRNSIKLSKDILDEMDTIKFYGIPHDSRINEDKLLHIPKEGLDIIDLFCENYDTLYESDLYHIDKVHGEVLIEDVSKYKMLIADYLKKDSYCINYRPEIKMYEVDVSSSEEDTKLLYDYGIHDKDKKLSSISNYKTTNIEPSTSYIVLRREGF